MNPPKSSDSDAQETSNDWNFPPHTTLVAEREWSILAAGFKTLVSELWNISAPDRFAVGADRGATDGPDWFDHR